MKKGGQEGERTPSGRQLVAPGVVRADWWRQMTSGRLRCELCPRGCTLKDGQRGFCFVREARDGQMVLSTYGRASGLCVDPIEKKPLNHFYPGSSVLSFGTIGCNLGCRFCQNWHMSKSRNPALAGEQAPPRAVAEAAVRAGCRSVAFTYNEPIIFAEYAIDCARANQERGIASVAVTNGYIAEKAREELYSVLDAANVDLKAFSEGFYRKLCLARLEPVLETLRYIKNETRVWLEVTTLLIPGQNDSEEEIRKLCEWLVENLGPEVPLHLSAFHPDYEFTSVGPTPARTLARARQQAFGAGLKHVYSGNVRDEQGQSTYCAGCGELVIERDWYHLGRYLLDGKGACRGCGRPLAGRFDAGKGDWGARRQRLRI
jgi:pyruvate formate lyase activating enzyme